MIVFLLVNMLGAVIGERQSDWSWLAVAALAAVVAYAVECAVWPMARCRLCGGTGKLHSPVTRSWRECRCDRGETVRWGARLFGGAFRGR